MLALRVSVGHHSRPDALNIRLQQPVQQSVDRPREEVLFPVNRQSQRPGWGACARPACRISQAPMRGSAEPPEHPGLLSFGEDRRQESLPLGEKRPQRRGDLFAVAVSQARWRAWISGLSDWAAPKYASTTACSLASGSGKSAVAACQRLDRCPPHVVQHGLEERCFLRKVPGQRRFRHAGGLGDHLQG